MNHRYAMIALMTAFAGPAFAASDSVVAGEMGYVPQEQPSTASRTAVLADLDAWKRNPVTSDGWRQIGGQIGWEYAGTTSALSRQQVKLEALRNARQLETADGYRFVGGEAGWVYVGTRHPVDRTAMHARPTSR